MKKSDSLLRKALYMLPRLILWGVCMLYFAALVLISLDYLDPYLYPLEYFRYKEIGRR